MEDEIEQGTRKLHCLLLTYPRGGHINPLLHFSNRLLHEGVRITLVTTPFCQNALLQNNLPKSITLQTISDGFHNGGFEEAESIKAYFARFWEIGPKSFLDLLQKLVRSENPNSIDCVIYDSFLPWALDVAKRFDLICVAFLTQSMFVTCVNLHANLGHLKLPVCEESFSLPGLPLLLQPCDLPSFLNVYGSNPTFFDLVVVKQFSNIQMADWVLCNSFYELEKEVVGYLTKNWPKLKTIGPTIPSKFIDKRLKDDEEYGINLFKSEEYLKWMDNKPKGSIAYISFGSYSTLNEGQTCEVAFALQESECYFLWVVRVADERKIPEGFTKNSEKGLVVTWCSQIKVLEHEALGCFVTHCGWNSTLEALSLGVPMICMPQWTHQNTIAKLVVDFWKIGLRVKINEKGIFRREALKHTIMEIMEGEIRVNIKRNAKHVRSLTSASDMAIVEFIRVWQTSSYELTFGIELGPKPKL